MPSVFRAFPDQLNEVPQRQETAPEPTGGLLAPRCPSQDDWTVTQSPERLSLPFPTALCDIFECTPTDLIASRANAVPRRTAPGETAGAAEGIVPLRPKRTRIDPNGG
ncbi:hypothetical protein [Nocardiopsis ansamitocini]|uniref:hypothetical protein n=1 Tax=Nocardiopsis ansamitocini TaxID=1670832 RepID=UPI002556FCD3|nr:hypothetical protein [Nocardiopsis ansamitocini]